MHRKKLGFANFEQNSGGSWVLNMQPDYADIFDDQEPDIMAKSNTGWRKSKSGKSVYAFFPDLADAEIERVRGFISDYKQFVLLGKGKSIPEYFEEELSGGLALDFNFDAPGGNRTYSGDLEYQAKYTHNEESTHELISRMARSTRRIPYLSKAPKPVYVTYIPPSNLNVGDWCLPKDLAIGIISSLDSTFFSTDNPLVESTFIVAKPTVKNMPINERQNKWTGILRNEGITFSQSVADATVIIVDDLYQSGTTMWYMAKYLIDVSGAAKVFGLTCVKSVRDSDNK